MWPVDIPRRIESLEVNIWSFYEDEHKRIWFGSDAGRIGYVDKNKKVFLLQELEGVNEAGGCIYQFVKDKAGNLWVATDNGLFLLDTEKKEAKLYRPKTGKTPWEGVFFIHEDADGSFWLGSKGLGLFHWNRETNYIKQFTKADGLSNNTFTVFMRMNIIIFGCQAIMVLFVLIKTPGVYRLFAKRRHKPQRVQPDFKLPDARRH